MRVSTSVARGRQRVRATGAGGWPTVAAVMASLLVVGERPARGVEYRWFTDEAAYLAQLTGTVFTNDFASTPAPGGIPNPLPAVGGAGMSYEVAADGGLYRVFDGPYAVTPLNPATPLLFESVTGAAAFGGRFSLTDFDERRRAGTFSLAMSLGSGSSVVSTSMAATARADGPTFLGLVAYGLPSTVSSVTLSTTATQLFVTSERVSVGNPFVIDVPSGTQRQAEAGFPLLAGQTPVAKIGAGTLVLDSPNTLSATFTVAEGSLRLALPDAYSGERLVVGRTARVDVAPGVIAELPAVELAAGARLDVTTGAVLVRSGLTAETLVPLIVEGRDGGSWNGTSGITSTAAAADVALGRLRAVGWTDDGTGALLIGYAAPGDTNVDGLVDILDIAAFLGAGKLDTGAPAVWSEGDFGYDGIVDMLDVADFFATGLYNAGRYVPAGDPAAAVAAVPEPDACRAAVALAAWAVAAGMRRRGGGNLFAPRAPRAVRAIRASTPVEGSGTL